MDVNLQNVRSIRKPKTFNNPERFIEGWYWVIPSKTLRVGEIKPVTILGKKLVVYRGNDKRAVILDAYCPHMGAHLAEGKIEGNQLRCIFHRWKFDSEGICVDIPCLEEPLPIKVRNWPTAEKYGIIWVWTGESPRQPIPFVPELEFQESESLLGSRIVTKCHPNVVMINAIDTQHFYTVHKLPLDIFFEKQELNQNAITFIKHRRNHKDSSFLKFIRPLYKNPIYHICYWYGSTFSLTVGPDLLHLHVMFTLRIIEGGKAEVQTVFITKKRQGFFGWLSSQVVLWLTNILIQYFIKDDSKILQTIQFDLKTPIKTDQSVMQLIHHVERQKPLLWRTWLFARSPDGDAREAQEKWRDELTND